MVGEISGELVRTGFVREQPLRGQSRLDKLLGVNCSTSSSQSLSSDATDSNELDEFDEEGVWAADEGNVGGVDGGEATMSQNSTAIRTGISDRNGSALWGIGDNGILQRTFNKDLSPLRAVSGASHITSPKLMNGFPALSSVLSSQDIRAKSPTGRRSNRETIPRRIPTAHRMIPRGIRPEVPARRVIHQSAPVNIPDWNKILSMEKPRKVWMDDSDDDHENEEERLPPHQLLARDYARSQMTSFSVFEGAGRTLKGRDMSQVRDAVFTRTGFFG